MGASFSRPRARLVALSDEVQLHRLLRSILTAQSRALVAAPFARLSGGAREACDVVLLDLDRLDLGVVAAAKRVFPGAEILALCGESREADRVAALEMGADCLERPFRAADLRARVRAAELRRYFAREPRRFYRCGALVVDRFERLASRDGRPLALTPSERDLLEFLAREAGRAASFAEILEALGRGDSARDRQALRAFVSGLRRKIERDPSRPEPARAAAERAENRLPPRRRARGDVVRRSHQSGAFGPRNDFGEVETATLPADEDYARAMLTLFATRKLRAGESLPIDEMRRVFVAARLGRPADCEAALAYAETQGWVSRQLGRVRLSAAGYGEL